MCGGVTINPIPVPLKTKENKKERGGREEEKEGGRWRGGEGGREEGKANP